MLHHQIEHGLQIIGHNPNLRDIFARIENIKTNLDENFRYKVYLGPDRKCESYSTESKFEEQCTLYFEKYYESSAQDGPLILPGKATFDCSKDLGILTPILLNWCKETNKIKASIKGLVLQSFSIWKHLRWHGFEEKMIKAYLQNCNILEELSTIVYNPQEKAVLLLHKAKSENLATNIVSILNYLKLFILLFHNVLQNMKLIPLVVTDENVNPDDDDCHHCLNHVLSGKELPDFSDWLERREKYFQTGNENKMKEELSRKFLAKVTGILAAASIHPDYIPMSIDDQEDNEQMEYVKVLLTPDQMGIFYSQHKHMIIKGGFGCGKSIIAAAMLEKIAESLQNDEKLFHVCYDARSKLLNKMVKINQENSKVTPFHNKDGLMLSAIIDQITKLDKSKKINLVIDEYDGEDLDKSEADKLNKFFNESFKESYIVLIAQPIEKERTINNVGQEKNRFDILTKDTMKEDHLDKLKEGTMIEHYLTSNMRNSEEIHKLVEATKEVLKEKQTVFIHPKHSKIVDESEENEEDSTEMDLDEAETIKGLPMEESVQDYGNSLMGRDEAQAIIGSRIGNGTGGSTTESNFIHAEVDNIGHKIKTERPLLFEIQDKEEFQKLLSLLAIMEKLFNRKKHVVLHFDTAFSAIPSTLRFAFDHHFCNKMVTTDFKVFESNNEKKVLVCSYPSFRGLEHPRITVLIDRDIYFQQHYLVEMLARCTSKLSIVVLENSPALTNIIEKWKTGELVYQWKTKVFKKKNQMENSEFYSDYEQKIINGTIKSKYYEQLAELFKSSSTFSDTTSPDRLRTAQNIINKQR